MGLSSAIVDIVNMGLVCYAGKPIQLYPYQKRFIMDESRFRVVMKSRQVGMSFVIALEALFYALFNPDFTVLFVSTSERTSRNLMEYVKAVLNGIDYSKISEKFRDDVVEETKTTLKFRNGSRIVSLPNNPRTIRGYRADKVYLDEFAFMEDEREVWGAIIPTISSGGGVTVISTPNGNLNMYYDIIHNPEFAHFSRHKIHWNERLAVDPNFDIGIIKKSMPEDIFRQEYELEFIDEITAEFPYSLIMSCVDRDLKQGLNSLNKYNQLVIGVDFAKRVDSTVITVCETVEGSVIYRDVTELKPEDNASFNKQIAMVEDLCDHYSVVRVVVDQTGMGESLYAQLRVGRHGCLVNGIVFSLKSKEKLIHDLKVLFQEKRISIPYNQELILQLHSLNKIFKEGSPVVTYRSRSGVHDDYIFSLALAVSSIQSKKIFWGAR